MLFNRNEQPRKYKRTLLSPWFHPCGAGQQLCAPSPEPNLVGNTQVGGLSAAGALWRGLQSPHPHRYLFCCCLNCLTCMLHPCGGCWAETYLHGANWQMQPSADKTGGLVGLSSFTFSQQENKILFLEKDSIGVQTCQDSSEQQLPDCLPYSIRKSVLN